MEDNLKWRVVESEYVFRRPWLTARRDHVVLPTGAEIPEFYVLEYPDWVNVIALTEDGRFVLVRQYRHALGETRYELCAGVCEQGETPLQAARRELEEETGYGGGEWTEWMVLSANAGTMSNLTHCFLARGVKVVAEPHPDEGEAMEVHLIERGRLLGMLERGEIRQALMAAPLWRYFSGR